MQPTDPATLHLVVVSAAFALAVAFGAIAQRSHFCTMGALADIFSMGDWTRLRMWVVAIAVAVVGFNAMVGLGWIEAGKSVYGGKRLPWLSETIGGVMFGFGMVLASGCGSKSLVRAGAGNLKSLIVVVVLGLSAFATLKGVTGVLRVQTVDRVVATLNPGQDLPSIAAAAFGSTPVALAPWLGGAIGLALLAWVLARPAGRRAEVWQGGIGIGLVIVALWWVSGRLGHLAEDPGTLEEVFVATSSRRMEAMSMVGPVAYALDWLLFFSDRSKLLTMGIVAVPGVALGSAVVAWASSTFRWETFAGVEDTVNHLAGGVLMGVGGVAALGCTIGQGISGLSTLSVGSVIATAAIVAGGWLGLHWQTWRLESNR